MLYHSRRDRHNATVADHVVLLVEGDLMARARLEAAARDAGADIVAVGAEDLAAALKGSRVGVVVVDLDAGGDRALAAVRQARDRGVLDQRVIGYYSHVDAALGAAASAAGVEALPRGRFWRTLPEVLRPPS